MYVEYAFCVYFAWFCCGFGVVFFVSRICVSPVSPDIGVRQNFEIIAPEYIYRFGSRALGQCGNLCEHVRGGLFALDNRVRRYTGAVFSVEFILNRLCRTQLNANLNLIFWFDKHYAGNINRMCFCAKTCVV